MIYAYIKSGKGHNSSILNQMKAAQENGMIINSEKFKNIRPPFEAVYIPVMG